MTILGGLFGAAIGLAGGAASAYFQRLPTGPIVVLSGTVLFVRFGALGAQARRAGSMVQRARVRAATDAPKVS